MKVGTDGTLLGAWAHGGDRILDIGTGTGLIALMMAQRFPQALVTAIDIDNEACLQANENTIRSPFSDRIKVENIRLQDLRPTTFDAIVCNPPFFSGSLKSPDNKRTIARHNTALTYRDLFDCVSKLLADNGEFSAVIPSECLSNFETEAVFAGLYASRICAVKTTLHKAPRRFLLGFRQEPASKVEDTELIIGSTQYLDLVDDFYLQKQQHPHDRT